MSVVSMETSINDKSFEATVIHHYLGIESPFLHDVGTGIREQLETDLMSYSKKFKGVPVSVKMHRVVDFTVSFKIANERILLHRLQYWAWS